MSNYLSNGFFDELEKLGFSKLAAPDFSTGSPIKAMPKGETIKTPKLGLSRYRPGGHSPSSYSAKAIDRVVGSKRVPKMPGAGGRGAVAAKAPKKQRDWSKNPTDFQRAVRGAGGLKTDAGRTLARGGRKAWAQGEKGGPEMTMAPDDATSPKRLAQIAKEKASKPVKTKKGPNVGPTMHVDVSDLHKKNRGRQAAAAILKADKEHKASKAKAVAAKSEGPSFTFGEGTITRGGPKKPTKFQKAIRAKGGLKSDAGRTLARGGRKAWQQAQAAQRVAKTPAKPVEGSVVGKLALGKNMPKLPGARPTMVARGGAPGNTAPMRGGGGRTGPVRYGKGAPASYLE